MVLSDRVVSNSPVVDNVVVEVGDKIQDVRGWKTFVAAGGR